MLLSETKVLVQSSITHALGGISLAGIVRNGIGVPVPNRILGRYSLVYVFEGSGFYTDDNVTNIPVKAGDMIQISPNTRHGYGPKDDRLDWHEVYIIFEGPLFDVWARENCFDVGNPVTPLRPVEYWRERFLQTIQPIQDTEDLSDIDQVLRVQTLLLDIHKACKLDDRQQDVAWLEQAKVALDTCDTVQDAAAQLDLGYESFRKKFRKLYGVPPNRYQTDQVMQRACELLATDGISIKDIADQLDYCDEFHFSKRFSQIVGCAPSTYRARTLGK